MAFPPGRHGPGDLLNRIRKRSAEHVPHTLQMAADCFILRKDVFVYRLRRFPAVMALVLIFECASALWTFPHGLLSFPDHNVYAVPVAFLKLLSDRFQKPDQIAHVPVFILHAHIDDAAVVWYSLMGLLYPRNENSPVISCPDLSCPSAPPSEREADRPSIPSYQEYSAAAGPDLPSVRAVQTDTTPRQPRMP